MKICLVTGYPPNIGRGAESSWLLAQELGKQETIEEISVLANYARDGGERYGKVKIYRVWKENSWSAPVKIFRKISQLKPDIVHIVYSYVFYGTPVFSLFFTFCLFGLLKLFHYKTVVTIHQIFPQKFIDRDFQRAFATHIPIFMIRSAFYILNKVISVTAGTIIILHKRYKEIMADDYGIRNTVYIPIGLKEIRGLTKQEAKKVLGIEDKFMLLFFGFVAPFKGIDFALEAVRMIDQQVKERIVFIAAGSKLPSLENNPAVINYTQALKKQAIGLPVVFKDYYIPEREAETLFSAADLVLIPYQKQSGPSEIFKKAALYKIPVIASNIDYLAEDIRHMVTGILVSTDSPVHMAEAVEKLYSNQQLYHSIQVQLKKVAQEFDIRNTAQSHADLYHAVCFPRNIT